MKTVHKQVIIIGGGPGGLAAAVQLHKKGIRDILVIEREHHLGGILRQCIHDGFGLTRFGQTLSGPEYAQRFIQEAEELGIETAADTTVTDLTPERLVTAVNAAGLVRYQAAAVILTMGCRERTRGALSIPGERPAGVFTAGVAQTYINLKNTMVGRRAVILGSGDIGMIMARRLTLEGARVLAVFEIQPYPSGLARNVEQCLGDYGIPLYLSHTVTNIKGRSRLEAVTVSQVDQQLKPIPGTEKEYACDTLILSVGLIPENELSLKAGVELDPRTKGPLVDENYQTSTPGIFAAGNVLHVHDLVDFVSLEAERLADAVAVCVAGQGEAAGTEFRGEPAGAEFRGEPAGTEFRGEPAGVEFRGEPAGAESRVEPAGVEGRGDAGAEGRGASVSSGGLPVCRIPVEAAALVNYTVPQFISGARDVTLSLRVRRPLKNCRLEVRQGGAVLASKKLRKAVPAEMEQIKLPCAGLAAGHPVKVVIVNE